MAILPELGDKLSSQSVASSSGVGGWFLYYGEMPDSTAIADRSVSLLQTPGFESDAATEVDRPAVQAIIRGQSRYEASTAYEEAETKAQQVKTTLHAITPGTVGGHHYVGIWAEQDVFFGGYDEEAHPQFVINFRIQRSRT